ncbi:hypothetical protein CYMTET_32354, partial [Cymbomonas tetramitiformis]
MDIHIFLISTLSERCSKGSITHPRAALRPKFQHLLPVGRQSQFQAAYKSRWNQDLHRMLENGLLPELVYPPSSTAIGDGEATKIITALEVVLETAERFGNAGERQLSDVPSLVKGLLRTQNLAVQADLAKQKATEGDLEDAMRLYVNILETSRLYWRSAGAAIFESAS